jgi:hypothetical protein
MHTRPIFLSKRNANQESDNAFGHRSNVVVAILVKTLVIFFENKVSMAYNQQAM